jgi:hypothetical protein
LKDLLTHYTLCHEFQPNFSITCHHRYCHRRFKTIRCFRRHLKDHTEPEPADGNIQDDENDQQENQSEIAQSDENDYDEHGHQNLPLANNNIVLEENINMEEEQPTKQIVAKSVLALREQQKVPYKTCGSFLQFASTVVAQSDREMFKSIRAILTEEDVPEGISNRILSVIENNETEILSCMQEFEDPVKLNRFVQQNLHFVLPVEYYLGGTSTETMQYVPILDNLKALLAKNDVLAEVLNPHASTDGWRRDICDGNHFKMHPFWQSDPTLLQIILYFDEFTAVIQTGCHANRYKFAGIYYQLGNIQPYLRSQLHCMQLALMAKSKSIKKHGLGAILKPLITDLKRLETDGLLVETPQGQKLFFGSVLVTLSDNLGSHMIGNFLTSFVAFRSCRFCMVTRPELQTLRDISNCQRRSEDQYNMQADLVTEDASLRTVYGLSGKSPLNELNHYHVVTGLPPDVMHDLFESGLVTEVLQTVVLHYIQAGTIALPELCSAVAQFTYKAHDKVSRPEVTTKNGEFSFKQKASQVFCLLRTFPLILGAHVPVGNNKWEVLLSLKEMVDILLATEISPAGVAYLDDKVSHFHHTYQTQFDGINLKPKGHYTLHYREMVQKFGILRNLWTMRFEAKHSFFIDVARRTKNRKNLCKSFAMRHQYMECVHLESENFLGGTAFDIIGSKNVEVASLGHEKDHVEPLVGNITHVLQGDALRTLGSLFNAECVVVRGFQDDEIQFAAVKRIFVIHGTPMLFCEKMVTLEFSRHYQSYLMKPNGQFLLARVNDLPDPHPLPLYQLHGWPCTVLHHYVSFE